MKLATLILFALYAFPCFGNEAQEIIITPSVPAEQGSSDDAFTGPDERLKIPAAAPGYLLKAKNNAVSRLADHDIIESRLQQTMAALSFDGEHDGKALAELRSLMEQQAASLERIDAALSELDEMRFTYEEFRYKNLSASR